MLRNAAFYVKVHQTTAKLPQNYRKTTVYGSFYHLVETTTKLPQNYQKYLNGLSMCHFPKKEHFEMLLFTANCSKLPQNYHLIETRQKIDEKSRKTMFWFLHPKLSEKSPKLSSKLCKTQFWMLFITCQLKWAIDLSRNR